MDISRRIRPFAIALALSAIFLIPSRSARAGFLASDLGTGGSYNSSGGYTLAGPQSASGLGYDLAVKFQITGTSSVRFGSAELALELHSGTNSVAVLLMSDAGGMPGSTLESMQVGNISGSPTLITADSTVNTVLNPGTTYWLAAVASGTTYMTWMMNNLGTANDLDYQTNHGSGPSSWISAGPSNPDVAFAISAVPGPSSVTLLGVGLTTLGGFAARRRRPGR